MRQFRLGFFALTSHLFFEFRDTVQHLQREVIERPHAESRGARMASAAVELAGQCTGIDRRRTAHTRFEPPFFKFRKEDVHVGIRNRGNQFIENAVRLFAVRFHFRQILFADRGPYDVRGRIDLNPVQRAAPDAQGGERLGFVDILNDLLLTRAELEQLRSDFERVRRGIGILETARIGDKSGEQQRGHVLRDLPLKRRHLGKPVVEYLGGAGGGWINQLELPELRVADVVIDIENRHAREEIDMIGVERSQ